MQATDGVATPGSWLGSRLPDHTARFFDAWVFLTAIYNFTSCHRIYHVVVIPWPTIVFPGHHRLSRKLD